MNDDARKNLDKILKNNSNISLKQNNINKEDKSINNEQNVEINNQEDNRLFDTSDVQPDILIEKSLDKTINGLTHFTDKIHDNKKYRKKIFCVLGIVLLIILGYSYIQSKKDKDTGMWLYSKEPEISDSCKENILYAIEDIEYWATESKLTDGYILIDKNDKPSYFIIESNLNPGGTSDVETIVIDYTEKNNYYWDVSKDGDFDNPKELIKETVDKKINIDDYKIYRPTVGELEEITSRNFY